MNVRTVKKIVSAQRVNMGGNFLDQPLPINGLDMIDPFLLIHHWNEPLKPDGKQSELGVGPHPHRGFSPVTFIFKGSVRHQDSIGNTAVISEGGTQWMHAGKGIVHSERPGIDLVRNGGEQEFIQFWVNTPSKYKMEEPYYLPITAEETPIIKKENVDISIVAGEFESLMGPAKTYSPQTLLRIEGEATTKLQLPIPLNYNTLLYILNGEISADGKRAKSKDMIWFKNDGECIEIDIITTTRLIVLSGEPINEPIASYGPFVMNSKEELQQAVNDFHEGNMGSLNETFDS